MTRATRRRSPGWSCTAADGAHRAPGRRCRGGGGGPSLGRAAVAGEPSGWSRRRPRRTPASCTCPGSTGCALTPDHRPARGPSAATWATSSTPCSRATTGPSRSPSPPPPATTPCARTCSTRAASTWPRPASPPPHPWVEADRSEAITPVHVMGRLLNRRVDFLDADGRPLVLGFHAVGDAHTCTNPLYGRGCSLAMVGATLLADALAEHPDDPVARSVAYEAATEREIRPVVRGLGDPGPHEPRAGRGRRPDRRPRPAPPDDRRRRRSQDLPARSHAGRADAGGAHRRHRVPGLRASVQPARRPRCPDEPTPTSSTA